MTFTYNKAGLLAIRDNKILLCRKKHTTSLLIVPGGCFEPGETAAQCLEREVREELGEAVSAGPIEYIGTYVDVAAGGEQEAKTVRVELYRADLIGDPAASSEIKELVWFEPDGDPALLSPTLRNRILPDLRERGIWPAAKPVSACP
jgi:8-oxo-dGTP diphosphatase